MVLRVSYPEKVSDSWELGKWTWIGARLTVALEELTSRWRSELILHHLILRRHWREKGNLDEPLIYEVRSRVEHNMEVCAEVFAIRKEELSTWA